VHLCLIIFNLRRYLRVYCTFYTLYISFYFKWIFFFVCFLFLVLKYSKMCKITNMFFVLISKFYLNFTLIANANFFTTRVYSTLNKKELSFHDEYIRYSSKRKWIEMDRKGFCSCQIQILIFWIHFYPIKVSEFFKIHFNPYKEIKTKRFLFFSIKKKIYRPLIHFNLSKQKDFYFLNPPKK